MITTSREPLRVIGEMLYPMPPLTLPATHEALAEIVQCDALQLFVKLARSVRPDFALTAENAATLTAICREPDDLSLACVYSLPPKQLAGGAFVLVANALVLVGVIGLARSGAAGGSLLAKIGVGMALIASLLCFAGAFVQGFYGYLAIPFRCSPFPPVT